MWWISEKVKLSVLLLMALLAGSCLTNKNFVKGQATPDGERKIVLAMDSLLKAGQYVKAEHYGRLFLNRYEHSPYVDDVSYRLAYLHVIADDQNPFLDYNQAQSSFQAFLKKFPESQYALACNNWLKVLYLTSQLQKQLESIKTDNRQLKKELKERAAEIDQLKSTLRDLEKVIKR